MKKNILQTIFFCIHQYWAKFLKSHGRRIHPVVKKEVAKFQNCGDIRKGYRLFVCEGCHQTKLAALKCKGKFCPSCDIVQLVKVNAGANWWHRMFFGQSSSYHFYD
uniref:transposase zinc-binding domain-containing protein n=1 Tax=Lacticaseibacillus paracasei TaxID=1597 RepID=UPI001CDC5701